MRLPGAVLALSLASLTAPWQAPAIAQVPSTVVGLPPGAAGDVIRAYFKAMDAADSVAITAWITRYDPRGDLLVRTNRQLVLARRTGGFTIDSIVRRTENALEAILRERKTGVPVRLELELDPAGTVGLFGLQPLTVHSDQAPAGAARATPALSRAELGTRLRAFVDSLATAGQFSGVVSLSKRGTSVFERAYGEADRTRHTPNTLQTAFNVGSINKIFTSIAINQLAAQGKLFVDSSLARAWPEYPNADIAKRISIRQLLQHTSGVTGNIFALAGLKAPAQIRHNKQIVASLAGTPLAFEPGSRNQYSNAGYALLGGLVERVSGEDYYAYMQKHIYAPAGMTRSGHFATDSLPARTAIGYTRGSATAASTTGVLRANTDILPGRGSAAGGGYTTVGDLKRFLAALRSRKIAAGPPAGLGIAGGSPGVNAVIEGDLPGDYDLIVLSNFDPPAAERIAERVRAWLGVRD